MERLWTPWRHRYMTGEDSPGQDVFERLAAANDDEANLILMRGPMCFAIMNLFPYNTGHVMIVPYRRVADPADLTPDEWADLGDLLRRITSALRATLAPDGFNIGLNIGAAAGAGLPDHLHLHIVPRWSGDTNFMPVLGATKVLPELVPETYARLRQALTDGHAGIAEEPATLTSAVGVATVDEGLLGAVADNAAPVVGAAAVVANDPRADQPAESPPDPSVTDLAAAGAVLAGALAMDNGPDAVPVPVASAAAPVPARADSTDVSDEPVPVNAEAASPPEGAMIENPPPTVIQAGAIVLVRDKVALRLAKDQTWVLPKGHIEDGETEDQAAVREVAEEMGLSGSLGQYIDELRFLYRGEERVVRYYLLRADRHLPAWSSHFGRDTFLFSPREAVNRLTHGDARALLQRALELARQ